MFSVDLSTREWDGHVVVARQDRAGRIPSCSQGHHSSGGRSTVAHSSRPERQERPPPPQAALQSR